MPEPRGLWSLEQFLERLDQWIELETPPERIRVRAVSWIFTRLERPYEGVTRAPGFANLWFGPVPGTEHGGQVATCAYWIFEDDHRLRCESFATLSYPLG